MEAKVLKDRVKEVDTSVTFLNQRQHQIAWLKRRKRLNLMMLEYNRLLAKNLKVGTYLKGNLFAFIEDNSSEKWPDLFKLKLIYCHRIANFQAE